MAGTVAMVGVLAATLALSAAVVTAGAASAWSQRLSGVADRAALAAADAASGALAGDPCERAAQVAATADAELESCDIEGLVVTVAVAASFGSLPATVWSRAGPPP